MFSHYVTGDWCEKQQQQQPRLIWPSSECHAEEYTHTVIWGDGGGGGGDRCGGDGVVNARGFSIGVSPLTFSPKSTLTDGWLRNGEWNHTVFFIHSPPLPRSQPFPFSFLLSGLCVCVCDLQANIFTLPALITSLRKWSLDHTVVVVVVVVAVAAEVTDRWRAVTVSLSKAIIKSRIKTEKERERERDRQWPMSACNVNECGVFVCVCSLSQQVKTKPTKKKSSSSSILHLGVSACKCD